jgi:hypothetical protein
MLALSDSQLLELWERGVSLHPLDRALLVLGATRENPSNLADWPLGRRNQALAELRCSCFGPNLQAWISCSHCDERLEFEVEVPALLKSHQNGEQPCDEPVVINGHSFRRPSSRDLARAALVSDPHTAAIDLLEACRINNGASSVWSDADLDKIGEQLAIADPLAEIRLQFNCPMCGNQWEETLDFAAVLWSEIEAQAKRVLLEIHALASVYGWTEKDILSLSSNRRLLYLEMVQA